MVKLTKAAFLAFGVMALPLTGCVQNTDTDSDAENSMGLEQDKDLAGADKKAKAYSGKYAKNYECAMDLASKVHYYALDVSQKLPPLVSGTGLEFLYKRGISNEQVIANAAFYNAWDAMNSSRTAGHRPKLESGSYTVYIPRSDMDDLVTARDMMKNAINLVRAVEEAKRAFNVTVDKDGESL